MRTHYTKCKIYQPNLNQLKYTLMFNKLHSKLNINTTTQKWPKKLALVYFKKLNATNDTLSPMFQRSPSPVSHLLREYKTKIYYSISLKHLNMCTTVTQVSLTMPLQTLLCIGGVEIVGSYFWRSDRISRLSIPLLFICIFLTIPRLFLHPWK